jgi:hypothetical protein
MTVKTTLEIANSEMVEVIEIPTSILAVESVEQMRENMRLFSKEPLEPSLMRAVSESLPALSEHILMPNKWTMRMPDVAPVRCRDALHQDAQFGSGSHVPLN